MARAKRKRRPFAGLVTDNFGLKAASLGLAIVLFSLVHSDVDAQRSILVDVVALLPPPGAAKMLVSELPSQVKVTLRGSHSRISGLSRDDFPAVQMDLQDGEKSYFYFDPSSIEVGGNIQVVEVSPSTVPLTWATSAERRVPVEVSLSGALRSGLTVEKPKVRPARVTLRGPDKTLDGIESVSTEDFSLDGLEAGRHTRKVPLQALPDYVSYVEDVAVEIELIIEPKVSERTLRRIDVAAVGAASVVLRPPRVAVTLKGPQDELAVLDPDSVVPYVEVDAAQDSGTLPSEVKVRGVPEGFEVVRVTPASVLVRRKGGY